MELEWLNMALQLRWPWLQWTAQSKPWQVLPPQSTKSEMTMFRMCTMIHGDGMKTQFWHDRWINGQVPKDIASALYKLAWRKNISVAAALSDRRWMHGLRRVCKHLGSGRYVSVINDNH
jgi:hypothetical protein